MITLGWENINMIGKPMLKFDPVCDNFRQRKISMIRLHALPSGCCCVCPFKGDDTEKDIGGLTPKNSLVPTSDVWMRCQQKPVWPSDNFQMIKAKTTET